MNQTATRLASLLLLASLPAQRSLLVRHGAASGDRLGQSIRPAGDVDRDGVPDFLATAPGAGGVGRVLLISGRTFATLRTFATSPSQAFGVDAVGLSDVNGDGIRDIAVADSPYVHVFSGANGTRLSTIGDGLVQLGPDLCDAGDFDGDGHGDFVTTALGTGVAQIHLRRGHDGSTISVLLEPASGFLRYGTKLLLAGDLNGDGRSELLATRPAGGHRAYVFELMPSRLFRFLDVAGRTTYFGVSIAAGDVDGDGVADQVVSELSRAVHVFSGRNGAILRTIPFRGSSSGQIGLVGDLDSDGFADLAIVDDPTLHLLSLGRGATLATWIGRSPSLVRIPTMTGVGDLDSDGFGEIVLGDPSDEDAAGGFEVLSTRILAGTFVRDGACGGGPFPVQLGLTRVILGQTATAVCRDGPTAALGTLLFSGAPAASISLGVSTCSLWLDPGTVVPLWNTTLPQWSLPLPIPLVPQLAGFAFALQVVYAPTWGPLGSDLSNGVVARCGYQ